MSFWLRELSLVHESECTIMLQSKPVSEGGQQQQERKRQQLEKQQSCPTLFAVGGSSRDTIRAIQTRAHSISAVFAKLCR